MSQFRTDPDDIRARLRERMADRGMGEDYAALAALTGDSRQQVRRWVVGEVDTIPADYIGRLERAGFAAAQWLVTGHGTKKPRPQGEAERVLEYVQRVIAGELPVPTLADPSQDEEAEDLSFVDAARHADPAPPSPPEEKKGTG